MKILHLVPGVNDVANGMVRVANLIAAKQRADGNESEVIETRDFASCARFPSNTPHPCLDEVWVHGMWLPDEWRAMRRAIHLKGARLVRMPHGSLSPIYIENQGKWKKRMAGFLWERSYFAKSDRVVVTGEWEADWCRGWGLKNRFEVVDLKQFFDFRRAGAASSVNAVDRFSYASERPLQVLYLGRPHPLKGVRFLKQAVEEVNEGLGSRELGSRVELRVVSDHFGEELERDWTWCDVLCLPTLSENFGLVVAEALERGKRVITTDGAPAWAPQPEADRSRSEVEVYKGIDNLIYLRGFRAGTDEMRVKLLKDALMSFNKGVVE